ncbi:hypothetical protein D3C78_1908340 [compost metagenome]
MCFQLGIPAIVPSILLKLDADLLAHLPVCHGHIEGNLEVIIFVYGYTGETIIEHPYSRAR